MTDRNRSSEYIPDRGFIGRKEVRVANYLFESGTGQGHSHARGLVTSFLRRSPLEHHRNSRRLSRFLEVRGLTFRKSGKHGEQKVFPVPVTTSVVPLPKSQFDRLSKAAAVLVFCMRRILREVYGAPRPEESPFINSLPSPEREAFLKALHTSPHYLPQLHHPVMAAYPFFDQVGLDLVLVEDYATGDGRLPFRLLEINAGSPSGASNNSVLLEGLSSTDPSLLESLGPLCENDHFDSLRSTYDSLGKSWTGRRDGVAILIPPGGANAAAPEIHSLSARSGLTLCEAAHLYRDSSGWVRMRSVDGSDPVVTSIHSRVNSDSVLFDPEQGLLLRDQESGEALVCRDPLSGAVIRDSRGGAVPLESVFRVNGALKAIHERKLYLGGLNRLLDNKLLLDTLTRHAPLFYRKECEAFGLDPRGALLVPPEALPSDSESMRTLISEPEEWVVKSPNLSGGTGVHVLMALPRRERSRILREVRDQPGKFAYQRMVRIGRIPVSMKESSRECYRLANHAADLRMWVLYGDDRSPPKLTRNALVRFAPVEKGALSSTVNTSKGGGYAPFVIVEEGEPAKLSKSKFRYQPPTSVPVEQVPVFSAAQIIQIQRMLAQLRVELDQGAPSAYRIYGILLGLSLQVKEVAAFLDPSAFERIHLLLKRVESKIDRRKIGSFFSRMNRSRAEWVSYFVRIEESSPEIAAELDRITVLQTSDEARRRDHATEDEKVLKRIASHPDSRGSMSKKGLPLLRQLIRARCPDRVMTRLESRRMRKLLQGFESGLESCWAGSPALSWLNPPVAREGLEACPVWIETPAEGSATRLEEVSGRLVFEASPVSDWVQEARQAWSQLRFMNQEEVERARDRHFRRFPKLAALQSLVDRSSGGGSEEILSMLEVLPYARYNLEQYSKSTGTPVSEIFTDRMSPGRIALLEKPEWRGAGACFVRKSTRTSELLEGGSHLWISKQQSPICQAYTIGHELHHAMQVEGIRLAERQARVGGPLAIARFMNLYGNFFGLDSGPPVENSKNGRSVLYGLQDLLLSQGDSPVIREVLDSLREGNECYERKLEKYGGAFVSMMPSSVPTRVKALREVYPALENLKNLAFAASCGLRIPMDPVGAVLPCANRFQRDRHRELLYGAVHSPYPSHEVLRIIASHQLYGVGFGPESERDGRLEIRVDPLPIDPAKAYHQSQQ